MTYKTDKMLGPAFYIASSKNELCFCKFETFVSSSRFPGVRFFGPIENPEVIFAQGEKAFKKALEEEK